MQTKIQFFYYILFYMIKPTLILLLFVVGNSFQLNSDADSTTVQFPLNSTTILQSNYTLNVGYPWNILGSNWIWVNGTTTKATFETLFYAPATYNGQALLQIQANNTFYAYLNGISVNYGNTFNLNTAYVSLSCGFNNLTIKVQNTDPKATSSGLIFMLTANDNLIPTCSKNGRYNYTSCACQCMGNFTCLATQFLIGYPTCGCQCKNQGILNCNTSGGQVLDPSTCTCTCLPTYCKLGFQQNPQTCGCRCIASNCTTGTWNYNQCRCQ